MSININELKKAVDSDKSRAGEVYEAAQARESQSIIQPVPVDITGAPGGAGRFVHDRLAVRKELGVLKQTGVFARVDVTFDGEHAPIAVLVSKARAAGEVYKEGEWEVISYTSPLYAHILDRDIGDRYCLPSGRGGLIGASSKFESILPHLQRGDYRLTSGHAFIESEADIAEGNISSADAPTSVAYQAAETHALGEIIELADRTQRSAMHLPFHDCVLIEGPPGSGKTSIGIMRIPCLVDRQWEELGLDPRSHQPFHTNASMRVLVLNDEMVDYLGDLVRSLRIDGVVVETIHDMLRRICDEAKLLRGRAGREKPATSHLKLFPGCEEAYWAGFARHVESVMATEGRTIRDRCQAVGSLGISLWKGLQSWANGVVSSMPDGRPSGDGDNLALRAAEWHRRAMQSVPEAESKPSPPRMRSRAAEAGYEAALEEWEKTNRERTTRLSAIGALRDVVRELAYLVLDRRAITRAMFETNQFESLIDRYGQATSTKRAQQASEEWRQQYEAEHPSRTEADTVLTAWLATCAGLVPAGGPKAIVGDTIGSYTHLVVDEAQDLSPIHARILERLIRKGGTLTLVGDLRQRLHGGGVSHWDELKIEPLKRAAFTVNHRQSMELGAFVNRLHQKMFEEPPVWSPAKRRMGPVPRVARPDRAADMASLVANEIRNWRNEIPRATVAVLFDGRWASDARGARTQVRRFRDRLEDDLSQDGALSVELVSQKARGGHLRKTDCVIVSTVKATKGLEFDAVVFIDPRGEWTDDISTMSLRQRHGLYVATSRAKHGLSLVLAEVPSVIEELAAESLCAVL